MMGRHAHVDAGKGAPRSVSFVEDDDLLGEASGEWVFADRPQPPVGWKHVALRKKNDVGSIRIGADVVVAEAVNPA